MSVLMSKFNLIRLSVLVLLLTLSMQHLAAQGIMTTWIGDSTAGYSGDGGPANLALINDPYGVCFDAARNFYLIDQGNFAIRKVNATTNVITTIAGNGTPGFSGDGGPGTAALLSTVYGICTDASGNVYISDMDNHVVRKINSATGIITTVAGNGTAGYSGDGAAAISAEMSEPQGVCVYGSNLYITDYANACVRKVNLSTGTISTIAGNGTNGYSGDGGPAASAMLNGPSSICANAAGDLYIADETNFVIRKISAATGIITTFAGDGTEGYSGDDSLAVNAEIGFIDGICADTFGNVYINDLSCSSRKITAATGIINTMAGNGTLSGYSGDGGPACSELLNWPAGLCIDPTSGNIIIADQENNRIRRATQPGYFIPEQTKSISTARPVIFPNPSSGKFYIRVPDASKYSIADIYSMTGQKVFSTLLMETTTVVDLTGVAAGNYIVSVQAPGGTVFSQKITVND